MMYTPSRMAVKHPSRKLKQRITPKGVQGRELGVGFDL
jgi:hypothetical protein